MNNEIINQLREHAQELIEYTKTLSEEQIYAVPPSGNWSIIQICDHLMSVEYGIYRIMGTEGTPQQVGRESKIDKIIAKAKNREKKVEAPEQLVPKGKTDTIEKFIVSYSSLREKIISAIVQKDLTPVSPFPHIVFRDMTYEEWLVFIMHHANRHKDQMDEVIGELATS